MKRSRKIRVGRSGLAGAVMLATVAGMAGCSAEEAPAPAAEEAPAADDPATSVKLLPGQWTMNTVFSSVAADKTETQTDSVCMDDEEDVSNTTDGFAIDTLLLWVGCRIDKDKPPIRAGEYTLTCDEMGGGTATIARTPKSLKLNVDLLLNAQDGTQKDGKISITGNYEGPACDAAD